MAKMVIDAEPRTRKGKNEARRLRRGGWVPGVLYGAGQPSLPVSLNPKQLRAVLESETGQNTILSVQLNGDTSSAMIVDWQYEPLKGTLLHVDLKRIALDKALQVLVPVTAVGEAPGVKVQGGILEFVARQVELVCLPGDIPEHLLADISNLSIGTNLRARDLKLGDRVKLASDPDRVVIHVIAPKALEAEKPAEEAVAEAEAAPAEPEVIRKGKAEKEEAEEAAEPAKKEKKEK